MSSPRVKSPLARRRSRFALWKPGFCTTSGLFMALACTCAVKIVSAQTTYYWDGNTAATSGAGTNAQVTGTWGTSNFWNTDATGGAAGAFSITGPQAADTAVFTAFDGVTANNPTGAYTVTLSAAQSVAGIVIGSATAPATDGTLTLAGTGTPGLTIGAGGVILNGSSGDPTFDTTLGTITLAADQTWTINNAHVIAAKAAVAGNATTGNTRTWTLGYVNAFTSNVSGVISNGTAGGSLGLTLNNLNTAGTTVGAGTWYLSGTASSYTGPTTVSAGNLQFNSLANAGTNSSLGSNGIINLGGGAFAASLTYTGSAASTTDRVLNLSGTTGAVSLINNATAGTSTLSFTSALTHTGAGAKTLTLGGSNLGNNTFGGALVDSAGGGSLTLAKTGAGVWVLGGANTYTGGTNITGGTLSVNGTGTLGSNITGNNVTITGGNLLLAAAANFGANQNIILNSGGIGVGYTPAAPPTITDNTGTTGGVYGINYTGTGGVTSQAAGSLYSGYFFLGSFTGGTYTGATLGAGNAIAGSTSGATGAYRLGGGGGTLNFQNTGLLTGNNDLLAGGTGGGNVILPTGNTYTGSTTLQNGTLTVSSVGNVGGAGSSLGAPATVANGTINIGVGGNTATLNYAGSGETTNRVLNITGTGGTAILQNSGTGAVAFSANPVFTNTGAKTLQLGVSTDTLGGTVGTITDGTGAAKVSVSKQGLSNSTWNIGASTYTGNTTITGGVLSSPDVLASSPFITLNGSSTSNFAILQTQGTFARNTGTSAGVNLQPNSGFAAKGGRLTITLNGTGTLLAYNTTGFMGTGGSTLALGSTTSDNQVEITNPISFNTTDAFQRLIYVEKGVGGDSALLSGAISNGTGTAAASGFIKQGKGTLILSGSSTFSGAVGVSGGSLVAGGNSTGTVSGAFGTGTGPSAVPTAPSAIVLGDGNTGTGSNPSVLIGGAFTVGRPLTISNSGTNNAYSIGGTTDSTATFSGAITVSNTTATGNTFSVTQAATTGANVLNITGGITGGATNAVKTVNFNNTGAVNVNTVGISNGGGGGTIAVTKTNSGILTLAAANTYTGTTTVNGGVLLVDGSLAAGSAVTIGNGTTLNGTLGGAGTINGAVAVNPGSSVTGGGLGSVNTLTLASTLTLATGSIYQVDISAGTSDKLTIGGVFLSSGATININSGTLNGTSTYLIASYPSDAGSTFNLTNAPGYALADSGTTLSLVPVSVPEPSTWVLCSLSGTLLVTVARRKRAQA